MLDAHYKGCLADRKDVNAVTLTFGSQVKALPSFMWVYEKFYFCQSLNQYAANYFISAIEYGSFDVRCLNRLDGWELFTFGGHLVKK